MRRPSPPLLTIGAVLALGLLGAADAAAQPARPERADLPPNTIALTDLRAFRPTSANWRVAGDATADRARPLAVVAEPGTGVLVNVPTGAAKGHLLTTWEHGDLDLSLDVMLPKTSNAGVYLMGRYEVQLFDSWGVKTPTFADMGGIYQRWDESRGAGREGYEGTPPAVNASRAPGLWQHLEISFRAPRFEGKKKVANARFLRVVLNGVTVQENVEVTGPTRAALFTDERATGPLMIQGDHGPVAVRNIEYKSYTGVAKLSDLTYKAWVGEGIDTTWMTSRPAMREGAVMTLSSAPAAATNRFAMAYAGALTVPTAGRYRFTLNIDWVGTEAAMQGPAVARADLSIDGKPVIVNRGAQQGMQADVDLTGGKHAFALTFFKNRQWGDQRDVQLFVEGPGVQRQALHDESLLAAFGNPINPIIVQATTELVVLRSFEWHRGQ